MKTPYLSEKDFRKILEEHHLISFRITRAIEIVNNYFSDKKRDDGISYINEHIFPVALDVALFLYRKRKDTEIAIISALFHDLLEDTDFSETDIKNNFPNLYHPILYVILPLTKDKSTQGKSYTDKLKYTKNYLEKIGRSSYESKIIKIFDRINNFSCIHKAKESKKEYYIIETYYYHLPFAKSIDTYLYEKLFEIYKKQSSGIDMFTIGEKLKYKVIGVEIKVKKKSQPSSIYFEIILQSLGQDEFKIKDNILTLNITLKDVLGLKIDDDIKDLVKKLIRTRSVSIKDVEEDVHKIINSVSKMIQGHVVELKFH